MIYIDYYTTRIARDFTNLSLLRHRKAGRAYMVSMQNSGTHWLRHLIYMALSRLYNLPPITSLENIDDFFDPRKPPMFDNIQRIPSTHQIPNPLIANRFITRMFSWPRYLLLIRDPRYALVANYHKHKHEYGLTFSEFLRADQKLLKKRTGMKRFVLDIWWIIRFMNSWSSMKESIPEKIMVYKYEDLRKDTSCILGDILEYVGIKGLNEKDLEWCISQSSKENMSKIHNQGHQVVRKDTYDPLQIYKQNDIDFLIGNFNKYCKSTFGYDLKSGW